MPIGGVLGPGELGGPGSGGGGSSGSGTVTSVSVVTANGFAGTVANHTTTPAITIETTVTGLLKGNGTAVSAAVAGTDYIGPTTGSAVQKADGAGQLTAAVSGTDFAPGTSALATGLVVSTTVTGALSTVAAPAGTVVGTSDTQTLTNKRITHRALSTNAPGATPSIDTDNYDIVFLTGLATNITSMTTNLTGTPNIGDSIIICFTDNGTARTIAWGASFEASTIQLPLTTVISALLTVGFIWNSVTSKWRCVGVA